MQGPQYENIFGFNDIHDNVFSYGETAKTETKLVAPAPQVGKSRQQEETAANCIDQTIGYVEASAFLGDVIPDFVEIPLSGRRNPVGHYRAVIS